MKKIIKNLLSRLVCKKNRIRYTTGSYWGYNVKYVNLGGQLTLGKKMIVRPSTIIYTKDCSSQLIFKDFVEIGRNSTISARNKVEFGEHVITGPNVFISDSDHNYEDVTIPISLQGGSSKGEVVIGDGTWIGTNCVIIGNVHIGKNCVVGANSVVTKECPDFCVIAGIPAKIIKRYNAESKKWEKVEK